jgi:ribulose-5-phosphate 4-epimerase/fuculose-1-phosphate aldolase
VLEQYKTQISEMGKYIYRTGLTTKYGGNISVRDKDSGLIAIKPSSIPWEEISPKDVVIINENGELVEGNRKPSIETPMHTAVYRNFPDIHGVAHTHSRYSSVFCVARKPIPAAHINSVDLGGEVRTMPFVPPGEKKLIEKTILQGLKDRKAMLLSAHGALSVGEDLEDAVYISKTLEEVAEMVLLSHLVGGEVPLSKEEFAAVVAL